MEIVYKTPRKYMFLYSCYLSELGGQLKNLYQMHADYTQEKLMNA